MGTIFNMYLTIIPSLDLTGHVSLMNIQRNDWTVLSFHHFCDLEAGGNKTGMNGQRSVLYHRAKTEMKDCRNSVWEKGGEIQTEVLVMSWDKNK